MIKKPSFRINYPATLLVVVSSALTLSCGARHQTADQVEAIFARPALTLTQKMQVICNTLSVAEQGPKLENVGFARDACSNPGKSAQNLSTTRDFSFTAVRADGQKFSSENPDPNQKNSLLKLQTRSQIWMNRSIINVAANVGSFIQNGDKNDPNEKKEITIDKLREPFFDDEQFYFISDMQINSSDSASIKINNKIRIEGKKVNNSIVASVRTLESAEFKNSLFKDMRILVFVIPHANDIYIDILIDIDVYGVGLTSILKREITESFSKIIDDLIKKVF